MTRAGSSLRMQTISATAAVIGLVAADARHGAGVTVATGSLAKRRISEADRGIPEPDHRPWQGDEEETEQDEIEPVEAVHGERERHQPHHGDDGRDDKAGEQETPPARRRRACKQVRQRRRAGVGFGHGEIALERDPGGRNIAAAGFPSPRIPKGFQESERMRPYPSPGKSNVEGSWAGRLTGGPRRPCGMSEPTAPKSEPRASARPVRARSSFMRSTAGSVAAPSVWCSRAACRPANTSACAPRSWRGISRFR